MIAFRIVCLFAAALAAHAGALTLSNLRCEYRTNPLGVDAERPRLSWVLQSARRGERQTAYRVLVASSEGALRAGVGDLWDSGKVSSADSIQIEYGGKTLSSHQRCWWKARAWDAGGKVSDWSAPASWSMGMLANTDWTARWISRTAANTSGTPAPLFRKEFKISKPVRRAVAYVSGLGFFEMRLNGSRVGDRAIDPGWTDYRKRIFYSTDNVTALLKPGANAVAVMLGNGMYNVTGGRYAKFKASYGAPVLILQLRIEHTDGTVTEVSSDESWRTAAGPVVFNCIFGGEDYDARLEPKGWDRAGFDDSRWEHAASVTGPGGRLIAASAAPVKVMRTFATVRATHPKPGIAVYDLGQNFSGWPRIAVRGQVGAHVKLVCGELLDADGLVTQRGSGGPSWFTYTLAGGADETWHPRFTYYGFRYVQVEAPPGVEIIRVEGQFLHAAVERAGSFSTSSAVLNGIHKLIDMSVLSNLQSVLTDCPHREKLGWLEVAHLMAPSIMANYDAATFYAKIADDMGQAQTTAGLVPDIAPEYVVFGRGFRDSPEWGSAYIIAPWLAYQRYGDRRTLERHYDGMARYARYLGDKAEGLIVSHGLGDWCDIGPGSPGVSQQTPPGVTGTAIYYWDLCILADTARVLGRRQDAARYDELSAQVRNAFNRRFHRGAASGYASGSQTSNAMPLVLGLAEPAWRDRLIENLVTDVRGRGNAVTSGDVGHRFLLRALAENGRSDVVYDMVSKTDTPGYGFQIQKGATALTEAWDANPRLSQNHCMLGHAEEWIYEFLGGIAPAADAVGFDKIVFQPQPATGVDWVETTYRSIRGETACRWRREGNQLRIEVRVPVNATARIYVPAASREDVTGDGARFLRAEPGRMVYQAGSGTYRFSARAAAQRK
jgi:alpha-L-rhamnosidase